jgi:hypothetical protein
MSRAANPKAGTAVTTTAPPVEEEDDGAIAVDADVTDDVASTTSPRGPPRLEERFLERLNGACNALSDSF